ncbi:hypothetical protein CLOM_g7955 [Closterium sp. NIES-68]|nr:hypothetical protein CLOM_g7955 [Closterium sp. NIES-68]GJP86385.1 hypothetical protein CLOP_g16410 [Closterium sp. NIES-67]
MRHDSEPHKATAGRRLAVRLLVGGMDDAAGAEQSSGGPEVSERRGQRMHKSASEANVMGANSRGGFALAGSMGGFAGSGKSVSGCAMKAQLRAEQEELAYLGMEAERIERSGVIDIVNDDGAAFPTHLSWTYRGLDITPTGISSAPEAGGEREGGAGADSVLASWAQDRRELEAQVCAVKAELKRKDRELKAAGKAKAAAGREVEAVWGQVSALEGQMHELQADKAALEKEIQGLRALHVSSARDSGESAGARAADAEMAGMLKMVGDFSRRLALADDAVRRAEAKNDDLSERLRASEEELRGAREALRVAQEERDALAAEMKEALDTWAWTGAVHPAPGAATPDRGGSSGSGATGLPASCTAAWGGRASPRRVGEAMARNAFQAGDEGGIAMQQLQQRGWDIGGGGKSPGGGFSAGGRVRRPPRDPKTRPLQFDALLCSPSPP